MAKRRGSKILLSIIIILVVILGGAFFAFKTTKAVNVSWTEEDYKTYVDKVDRKVPQTGEFNLINLSKNTISCKGKRNINVSLTNSEVSSVLSKENGKLGPIKDVKVRFLGGNEGEVSLKLTENFIKYVPLNSYPIANNSLARSAINGTPIYMRVKVDKASPKSIIADVKSVSVGRIPLSSNTIKTIETESVKFVNNILAKYDNLAIEDLNFDEGNLNFKGTIPTEVNVSK